jgi:antitoxin (DNA-binding transcriptional repressor) of toxin-antitoxin stability system
MNATIVDLRYRMKDVLRAIERGDTVTVLYRGKPKAALMPIPPSLGASDKGAPKTAEQPLFGLWKDRKDLVDPASWLRHLRQPRLLAGPRLAPRLPVDSEARARSKRPAGKSK